MSNSKKELYEFYESIKQGNKCFSAEELDVAIESLKLAQQTRRSRKKEENLNWSINDSRNVADGRLWWAIRQ